MKNKISYVIGSILLLVVVTPSIALASWWNPFTWFTHTPIVSPAKVETVLPVTVEQNTTTVSKEDRIKKLEDELAQLKANTAKVDTPVVAKTKPVVVHTKTNSIVTPITPTIAPVTNTLPVQASQDPQVKIEKCKAQAQNDKDNELNFATNLKNQLIDKIRQETQDQINQIYQNPSAYPDYSVRIPYLRQSIEKRIAQMNSTDSTVQVKAQQTYDVTYHKCLNNI